MDLIENRTIDEIGIGDRAEIERVLTQPDMALFATVSADVNPASLVEGEEEGPELQQGIAHGMWAGTLISAVLATQLPRPGTVHLGQTLKFHQPVSLGDRITVRVEVTGVDKTEALVQLDCLCLNAKGETVVSGHAEVQAPRTKIKRHVARMPSSRLTAPGVRFGALVEQARALEPLLTAIVHPCDDLSLGGAIAARDEGMIVPVLVGPAAKIEAAAKQAGLDLRGIEIVDTPHSHAAAEVAVALVHEGRAGALMKGKLHTDELLTAVLDKTKGLRTERRLSHVFALDVPGQDRTLFVTDAAINISPDLEALNDIVQNAIDLAHSLGLDRPLVAILSATEEVDPKIASTIDAAALCKMADRGQIRGGVLDGPLAFDLAISREAVEAKGFVSPVAGAADILVVPTLEAGNMIAKQLDYLAGAAAAGLVAGAKVPIILTSRADSAIERVGSCALAKLYAARPEKPS